MKKLCMGLFVCVWATLALAATTYTDATGEIDAGLSSGNGTLDIVSMEVSHTATDVIFDLTVDGNLGTTDWGKFMIGIATGEAGSTTVNASGRPIYLDSPIGGMNYWIESWVDSGGGAWLYNYDSAAWQGPSNLTAFSFTPGAQSLVRFTAAQADLGLSSGDTFYFDVYSSGGGGTDSAIDALSNPNISVTAWDQSYTSRTNDTGLSSYTLQDNATADVTPSNGPFAGGNAVVVTNAVPAIGAGGDITNVLVGGVAATFTGQGTNWVSFIVPAVGSAGVKDIVVQSASEGSKTVVGAYTVNPAGTLGGMVVDGFAWTNLAQGFNGDVYAIHARTNGEIYAGGAFTSAVSGAASLQRIARWDGAAWTDVGIGFNNSVRDIRSDSTGTVYAVGDFNGTFGFSQNCRRIGRWDGVNWTNVGQGVSSSGYTVTFDTNDVPYFGGTFTADGYGRNFGYVAKWNGSGWTNIYGSTMTNRIGFNNTVYSALRGPDGTMYFGGNFTNAITPTGEVAVAYVAAWDGTELRPMGAGFNGMVYKLAMDSNGTLYACGSFTASGSQTINRVAKWTGTAWTNVGAGVNSSAYALAFDANGNLYMGGSFTSPGLNLAMWDGSTWSGAAAASLNGIVQALALYSNETMLAGGAFTSAGGVATNRIGLVRPNRYYDAGVSPSSGSWTGGYAVAIIGENIGNGDITNVTLCGVAATIRSQTVNRVWVTAGVAATAGAGDVVVQSTSFGETVGAIAFTYTAPGLQVLGTNGVAIASGDAAQAANGTKFPQLLSGASWTNTFSITNNGNATLNVSGFGNSNPNFEIAGLPATVAAGTASNFTVKFSPTSAGTYNDWLTISNDSPTAAYVVRLYGPCYWISTNVGPFGGGNEITIANGNFGDITNVLVGGVAATIVESSGSIFTIELPAGVHSGTVDILVQTSDEGDVLLRDAYTYNPQGEIGWTTTEIGWTNVGSGMGNWVEVLAHDGTTLYAGGMFTNAGATAARYVAQWNGTAWSSLGSGMNQSVRALAIDGANLYAGGFFTNAGGTAAAGIARWNGTAWSALGSGLGVPGRNDGVWDVAFAGTDMYAAGRFTNSGATALMNVARWNGTAWLALGDGLGRGADGDTFDVYALAHDGANLYAGGEFTNSGAQAMNRISMWNGTSWTSLGSGMDDDVRALLHDGTNLYAAGAFRNAGGVAANRIAMWDGTSWSALGSGMDFVVDALEHDGTNLYAGGYFTTAGGQPAAAVAKWDGTNWSPLGSGMVAGGVHNLCFHGLDLYAGGNFATAGGVAATNVAQWKTTILTNSGVSPSFGSWTGGYEVAIGGSNLSNGGDVTNVTLCGVAATILSQNATQVVVRAGAATLPGIGDVRVFSTSYGETAKLGAFTYEGAAILVSGPAFGPAPVGAVLTNVFTATNSGTEALTISAATNSGAGAAMFDVSALAGLTVQPGTASNFPVTFTASAVGAFNPACHAANNSPVPNYYFGLYGSVYQLSASSGPQAGGNVITVTNGYFGTITNVLVGPLGVVPVASGANWFTIVVPAAAGAGTVDIVVQTSDNGETTLAGVYTYNAPGQIGWTTGSTVWTNLGSGLNNTPLAMAHDGANLYAGGMFTQAGGQAANRVATWNGTSWWPLGSGLDNNVYGLSSDGANLYAVGTFGWAGGVAANRVAKWDGSSWSALGSGLGGNNAQGVLCAGSEVYVVGGFTNAGGVAANYVAKWDGTNWTNLGSGLNSSARCLAHDGTNLYVGGQFTNAGGVAVMNVAKWDGTSWTNLGAGIGDRWASVYSLNFIGNSLYACGLFDYGSGRARVAMWNGSSWVGVGGGVGGDSYALAQDGTNLYVGGNFTSPGNRVAKWNGTAWSALGSGLDNAAWTLAHDGTRLYAGGSFSSAGGLSVSRIAMWTPTVATNPGVAPLAGSYTGNYEVVIQGYNLGNGTDITNVTLCGVAAAIQSQNATQVVVVAGAAAPGLGDVRVFSASQGETTKSNGFTYTAASIAVSGPAFGPMPFGAVRTNVYTVTNSGTEALLITAVTNVGAGATMFDVSAIPATVAAGTASNFPVTFTASAIGTFTPAVHVANNSLVADYVFGATGHVYQASTNAGPFAGGNVVTITNGNFGTITNVLVGGVAATILDSGTSWVTVAMPSVGAAGAADVVVQTSDNGDVELPGAYTYNPAGTITGVLPATGSCTGGYEVAIGGTNLGNGTDVTNATICGVAVDAIVSQSSTQVVVVVAAGAAGLGDVVVYSESHGETVEEDAFEYVRDVQAALVFAPASPQVENTTNALSVAGGSGTGAVSFVVMDGPGLIVGDTNLVATAGTGTITVVATKAQDDLYFAASATATVAAVYLADVYLLDLRQIYDGTAKAASATTMPAGLTVQFTYDGSATAPTATGTYEVVGTVNDGEYYATATGTLRILTPWDYQHVNFGDGWCWTDWFGFYAPMGDWTWVGERGYGWLWHEKHGFFYLPDGQLLDETWLFANDMGWLWSGDGIYPFLYRQEDETWLWYDGGTNPRRFFNFTTEQWESLP